MYNHGSGRILWLSLHREEDSTFDDREEDDQRADGQDHQAINDAVTDAGSHCLPKAFLPGDSQPLVVIDHQEEEHQEHADGRTFAPGEE